MTRRHFECLPGGLVDPDPTLAARQAHPSNLAPLPPAVSAAALYEFDELGQLVGHATADEMLRNWLIDNEPAKALQAVRELSARWIDGVFGDAG